MSGAASDAAVVAAWTEFRALLLDKAVPAEDGRLDQLSEMIMTTPAHTPAGVLAKLRLGLWAQHWQDPAIGIDWAKAVALGLRENAPPEAVVHLDYYERALWAAHADLARIALAD